MGGPAPFGTRWNEGELVPDLAEAAVVLDLVEAFVDSGGRVGAARAALNSKGRRTRRDADWSDTAIRRVLKNPALAELLPKELWARCQPLMSERGGANGQPHRRSVQPLGSVVHCRCGGRMYARGKGLSGKYICRSCRAKIALDTLEELFRSGLGSISIDATELVAAVADNPRAAELTRRLGGNSIEISEVWPLLDRSRQRQLVDLLVDRIVVDREEVSLFFSESCGNTAESAPGPVNSLPSSHNPEARTNGATSRAAADKTPRPAPAEPRQSILDPKAYRIQHVAELLSIPRSTLYEMVRTGALASVRTGTNDGVVLVPASAVEALLEKKKRRR